MIKRRRPQSSHPSHPKIPRARRPGKRIGIFCSACRPKGRRQHAPHPAGRRAEGSARLPEGRSIRQNRRGESQYHIRWGMGPTTSQLISERRREYPRLMPTCPSISFTSDNRNPRMTKGMETATPTRGRPHRRPGAFAVAHGGAHFDKGPERPDDKGRGGDKVGQSYIQSMLPGDQVVTQFMGQENPHQGERKRDPFENLPGILQGIHPLLKGPGHDCCAHRDEKENNT